MQYLPMLLTSLTFLLSITPCEAETRWVDAVHGVIGAPGTQAQPMASVTEALADLALHGTHHRIHLASGSYGASNGEVFPWAALDSIELIGSGDDCAVMLPPSSGFVFAEGYDEVVVTRISFLGTGTQQLARLRPGGAELHLHSCSFTDFGVILSQGGSLDTQMEITVTDCEFRSCIGLGDNQGYDPGFTFIDRCLFDGCVTVASGAIFLGTGSNVWITDSVIIRGVSPTNCIGNADYVAGCTIAYNAGVVPRLESTITPIIRGSIIAWNGDGTQSSVSSSNSVQTCLVHDVNGTDSRSVVDGPPLFVDGPNGDVRLRFGSPAVDVSGGPVGQDRAGRSRRVDGDLDQVGLPDLGALELHTLDRPVGAGLTIALGQPYSLELTGPAGSFSQVAFSRLGVALTATTTPYGDMFLRLGVARVAIVGLGPGGHAEFSLPLQGGSGLIGLQLGFQAVTRSGAAPNGGAWTNPVRLTIVAP